jgi:hypothetical protein
VKTLADSAWSDDPAGTALADRPRMQPLRQSDTALICLTSALALSLSGCAAIEGIFKAGMWVGVIAVVIVLAVAFGLVRLFSAKS